jgi:hypothetical protein
LAKKSSAKIFFRAAADPSHSNHRDWQPPHKEEVKMRAIKLSIIASLAIFFACAAPNEQGPSPEYWEIERRWIAGQFREITRERLVSVRERMGL